MPTPVIDVGPEIASRLGEYEEIGDGRCFDRRASMLARGESVKLNSQISEGENDHKVRAMRMLCTSRCRIVSNY